MEPEKKAISKTTYEAKTMCASLAGNNTPADWGSVSLCVHHLQAIAHLLIGVQSHKTEIKNLHFQETSTTWY